MTSTYQLRISANATPEILERLLRTTRHRGFQVTQLTMKQANQGEFLTISLEVESGRPISQLERQLMKLWDVSHVHRLNPV